MAQKPDSKSTPLAGRIPGEGHRPQSRWRQLLGRVAPHRSLSLPPVGLETFVHWLELESTGRNGWNLLLRWRLHRPNPRGWGRGRRLRADRMANDPPGCMADADRRVVASAWGADGARMEGDGTFTVAPERVDGVLRELMSAPHVYWEGTAEPVRLEPDPVFPKLHAEEVGETLRLNCGWVRADGAPWLPVGARVLAGRWPWVEEGGILRPIHGVADGEALATLLVEGAVVPAGDVAAFLGTGVPAVESWGGFVEVSTRAGREMVVDQTPRPRLYLGEEQGLLFGELRFGYGDYEVAAENPDPVIFLDTGSGKVGLQRQLTEEFAALDRLRALGFLPVEPGRFEMQGERALDFIVAGLPELLAQWEVFGREELTRYRVRSAPMKLHVRLSAGIDWLDLFAEGEVEGQRVEMKEVARAFRRRSRYVRLGDGSHALLPEQWMERLGAVADELALGARSKRLDTYQAGSVERLMELAGEVELEGGEHWDELLRGLSHGEGFGQYPLPDGLECTLRPYQLRGYHWLRFLEERGLGGVLADDMGLGKTVQTLTLLLSERERNGERPSLVVAPTSVLANWEEEARRHAPTLPTLRYHGIDRERLRKGLAGVDLVVTSYAVLRRDVEYLEAVDWNYVILDEAQAIKNASTQTARAVRRIPSRRRLTLTGTPLENHLGELWSQFRFLMPELLGSERKFADRYHKPILRGEEEAAEALRSRIRPFVLRRMKSEVAPDLPPKVENVLWSEFGPEQAALYRSLLAAGRDKVLRALEGKGFSQSRSSILEVLLRLRQASCHPGVLPEGVGKNVPSAKFDQFCDFVTEVINEGHRVLVYSQFVQVLAQMRQWFDRQKIGHLYLDGSTRNREEQVARFQRDATYPVFLVSLKAGGTGLNLTGADYVILFDPWWNPAVEAQAADRTHRIGQNRTVFSYKMIARGSIEEKIQALQQKKRRFTADFIRSEMQWGALVEEADLDELLTY